VKPYPDYKPSGVAWLGDVPGHWEVAELKRLFRLVNGSTPSSGEDSYWDGDLVWVTPADLGKISDKNLDRSERMLTYEGLANCGASMVTAPSIVISTRAPIGHLAIGTVALCTNQGCRALVPHRQCDVRYFYYLLALGKDELQSRGKGSTFLELSTSSLGAFEVSVPAPDEQQAIADYLDTETARIDALILEKVGLIGLLGEYRQSVIADLTTGANLTVPKTQTDNVFCPSIPSEWQMVRLGKYARIGNGSTPLKDNADYWVGGTFPWLNSAVVNQDEVFEGSELVTDEALHACHLPIVQAGAVLIALTGQGKTQGQVTVLRITATINQHLAYLTAEPSAFATEYLFWTLTGMYAALRMVSDGQGGTKGALTCEDLSRFQIPKPPLAEQQAIAVQVKTETARIDALIHHAKEEIALLKELRAATIADAVLGRVDVRRSS
jgi:type I restriction enzyme S subunit